MKSSFLTKTSSHLTEAQQQALQLTDTQGHGKLFVISYPDKLLTTPYATTPREPSDLIPTLNRQTQKIDLYMHIPFCASKCSYCHFSVSVNQNEDFQTRYVDKLIHSVKSFLATYQGSINSVDIGGGTPLLLSENNLKKISQLVHLMLGESNNPLPNLFSFEQTEALAAKQPQKMQAMCYAFPNRAVRTSIGIQSFVETDLTAIKRPTISTHQLIKNCEKYLANGSHFACDLIFPLGSLTSWKQTIDKAISMGFDTITAYDLIDHYGGGPTSFHAKASRAKEEYGTYYDLWYKMITDNHYVTRYGSNNAIKKSTLNKYLTQQKIDLTQLSEQDYLEYACQLAVSTYFNNRLGEHLPFVGFGLGASSCLPKENGGYLWAFQQTNLHRWMNSTRYKDLYDFPKHIWITKSIRFSLANKGAIDDKLFLDRYAMSLTQLFPEVVRYLVNEKQWMSWHGHRLCLNHGSYTFLAHIRALFTDESVLKWIISMQNKSFLQLIIKDRHAFDQK
jgi:coproporphyrinogen III oxidase-like Fe-S oxidoreductase